MMSTHGVSLNSSGLILTPYVPGGRGWSRNVGDGYYSNYDDVLGQLTDFGLLVGHLEIDTSKPRRCRTADNQREKRGWYWLSTTSIGGDSLITGAYGIYQGNDNGKQVVALPKDRRERLTPEQTQALKARQREAQKRAEAERQREADKAAERAAKAWKSARPDGTSEYLTRKQIAPFGIRFSPSGSILIPMRDDRDNIRGIQFIHPRGHKRIAAIGTDKEFWPRGLQMKGTYHLIGGAPREILLIAEGYATAASIHIATGLPVVVVWSANNILPACQILKKKYRRAQQLICADDDWLQKCSSCGEYTPVDTDKCRHCDGPHRKINAGLLNAEAAAIAVNGAWIKPIFANPRPTDAKGPTDFNDLHVIDGLLSVQLQIEGKLDTLAWGKRKALPSSTQGGGGKRSALKSMLTIDEAVDRFALVYGGKSTMFDFQEHILVPKADVIDILPEHGWRDIRDKKRVVRLEEVGFDPAGTDPRILCNLWGGWPTTPKQGTCSGLLDLLYYLCSKEENSGAVYEWVLKWLAYPIQHPGAKMKTALIFHGPQGTGKNLFFESIMAIYGEYGRIVDQAAIEDKFNDWASKKLFLIADEVVARSELYHIKNKLKCFVTGEWIRINPKNVAAHDERNHVNLVFLSNESQPLVLEKDDRRYAVIHTPEKMPEKFYGQVWDEIKNGGIAALHHYLLNLELGDFDTHTKPPTTQAKNDLIEVSLDSVNSFIRDWQQGDIADIPFCPCHGEHLFMVYRKRCDRTAERTPRTYRQFIGAIKMLEGWRAGEPSNTLETLNSTIRVSRRMVIPPHHLLPEEYSQRVDQTKEQWLTESYFTFARAGGFLD